MKLVAFLVLTLLSNSAFALESYQSEKCGVFKYIDKASDHVCSGNQKFKLAVSPCRCVDAHAMKMTEISSRSAVSQYVNDNTNPKSDDFSCYRIEKKANALNICRLEPNNHKYIDVQFNHDLHTFHSPDNTSKKLKELISFLNANKELKLKVIGMSAGSSPTDISKEQAELDFFISKFGSEEGFKKFYSGTELKGRTRLNFVDRIPAFIELFGYMNLTQSTRLEVMKSASRRMELLRLARAKKVAEMLVQFGLQQNRIVEFRAANMNDLSRLNHKDDLNRRIDLEYVR